MVEKAQQWEALCVCLDTETLWLPSDLSSGTHPWGGTTLGVLSSATWLWETPSADAFLLCISDLIPNLVNLIVRINHHSPN